MASSASIFNPERVRQIVTVQECDTATCIQPASAVSRYFRSIRANAFPDATESFAYPASSPEPIAFPSVAVIGVDDDRVLFNTFNPVHLSKFEYDLCYGRYCTFLLDQDILIDKATTSFTTSNVAGTYVNSAVIVNTDFTASWGLSGALRPFGQLVAITVGADVQYLDISVSGTAAPYGQEQIRVLFKENDCRTVYLFAITRCSAATRRFVGKLGSVNQNTLHYLLPSDPASVEAPGVTTNAIYISGKVINYSGVAVAQALTVDRWIVPYSGPLSRSLNGIFGLAGSAVPNSNPVIGWQEPNRQGMI